MNAHCFVEYRQQWILFMFTERRLPLRTLMKTPPQRRRKKGLENGDAGGGGGGGQDHDDAHDEPLPPDSLVPLMGQDEPLLPPTTDTVSFTSSVLSCYISYNRITLKK